MIGSTVDIYRHEWVSFTTKDFPENAHAKSGEIVRIVMKDVNDRRPVVDVVWFPEDYLNLSPLRIWSWLYSTNRWAMKTNLVNG